MREWPRESTCAHGMKCVVFGSDGTECSSDCATSSELRCGGKTAQKHGRRGHTTKDRHVETSGCGGGQLWGCVPQGQKPPVSAPHAAPGTAPPPHPPSTHCLLPKSPQKPYKGVRERVGNGCGRARRRHVLPRGGKDTGAMRVVPASRRSAAHR